MDFFLPLWFSLLNLFEKNQIIEELVFEKDLCYKSIEIRKKLLEKKRGNEISIY
jgi:hypothetical protein